MSCTASGARSCSAINWLLDDSGDGFNVHTSAIALNRSTLTWRACMSSRYSNICLADIHTSALLSRSGRRAAVPFKGEQVSEVLRAGRVHAHRPAHEMVPKDASTVAATAFPNDVGVGRRTGRVENIRTAPVACAARVFLSPASAPTPAPWPTDVVVATGNDRRGLANTDGSAGSRAPLAVDVDVGVVAMPARQAVRLQHAVPALPHA